LESAAGRDPQRKVATVRPFQDVELGATGSQQNTLSQVPQHFLIDRVYMHGDPTNGQRRGVALNSGDTQVLNSYFADFKGKNVDTQAIRGWNGPGPYLVENNYLEAAGENIMFGGSDPSVPNLVPTGITIRHNYISRPMAWMNQGWTVKNEVEFKNAQNAVVEGNIIENHWVGGQQGSAIVVTPRNQSNTAPWSVVRDITFQNNIIRHVSSAFNILGYDNLAPSQQTESIVVRNNLLYDVSSKYTSNSVAGPARLAIVGAGPKNVTFDHNTIDNDGASTLFLYGGATPTGVQIAGFTLTNNLLKQNSWVDLRRRGWAGTAGDRSLRAERDDFAQHVRGRAGETVPDWQRLSDDRAVAGRFRQPRECGLPARGEEFVSQRRHRSQRPWCGLHRADERDQWRFSRTASCHAARRHATGRRAACRHATGTGDHADGFSTVYRDGNRLAGTH